MLLKKTLLIGQARIDITPHIDISMIGHGEHKFTGLKDRLYATSMIFSQGKTKVCIITTDLIGFSHDFTNDVQRRIAKIVGTKKTNIVLCATHNHTGPDVLWPLEAKNNIKYINKLKKKLITLAKNANKALRESSIGAGVGKASIGINRRLKVKKNIRFAPNPKGAYDKDVIVVKISGSGKLKGLITSHACHPTVERDRVISADYPGWVRKLLKKRYGPNTIISFLTGCCGNVRPNGPYKKGRWTALTARQVSEFKKAVVKTGRAIVEETAPSLSFVHSKVELPLDKDRIKLSELKKRYEDTVELMRKEGVTKGNPKGHHNSLRIIKGLAKSIRIKTGRQRVKPISADIALMKVGKIIFVFLPGEVFTEIGLQIKALKKNCIVVPVSLYNAIVTYICTGKACKEGGFEPDDSFPWHGTLYPFPFSGSCEKIILKKVSDLLERLVY